jgi:hypothetical protein
MEHCQATAVSPNIRYKSISHDDNIMCVNLKSGERKVSLKIPKG